MGKVYERTQDGCTVHVSIRRGLDEINKAQMAGKRDVRTMSSITRTGFAIEYKDGRNVRLVQVDGLCGNEWKHGKDACARQPGHVGPHRNTKAVEAWTFSWFDSDGTPADADVAEEPTFDAHVISYNGGKVHTAMPGMDGHSYPLCRGGGQNQHLTKFRPTTAPLSCKTCMGYAEGRAVAARKAKEGK